MQLQLLQLQQALQGRSGGGSSSIPRQVQLARLAPLREPGATRGSTGDGLAFTAWRETVALQLRAARMLDIIEPHVPPPPATAGEAFEVWGQRDAVVFTSILQVVAPGIATQLRQVSGSATSSRAAMDLLARLYWRPSIGAVHELERERSALRPLARESMSDFLTRAEELRRHHEIFQIPLEDWRLCSQVFESLGSSWVPTVRAFGTDVTTWVWAHVVMALQDEDNLRRSLQRPGETPTFPCLGSVPRQRAAALEASGLPAPSSPALDLPSDLPPIRTSEQGGAHAASAAARAQFSPHTPSRDRGFPSLRDSPPASPRTPRTPGGTRVPRLCWYCQEPGHVYQECTAEGRTDAWRASAAQLATVRSSPRGTPRGSGRGRSSFRRYQSPGGERGRPAGRGPPRGADGVSWRAVEGSAQGGEQVRQDQAESRGRQGPPPGSLGSPGGTPYPRR